MHREAQEQNVNMCQLGCHCFDVESPDVGVTVSPILSSSGLQSLRPYAGIFHSMWARHSFICYFIYHHHNPDLTHVSVGKRNLDVVL